MPKITEAVNKTFLKCLNEKITVDKLKKLCAYPRTSSLISKIKDDEESDLQDKSTAINFVTYVRNFIESKEPIKGRTLLEIIEDKETKALPLPPKFFINLEVHNKANEEPTVCVEKSTEFLTSIIKYNGAKSMEVYLTPNNPVKGQFYLTKENSSLLRADLALSRSKYADFLSKLIGYLCTKDYCEPECYVIWKDVNVQEINALLELDTVIQNKHMSVRLGKSDIVEIASNLIIFRTHSLLKNPITKKPIPVLFLIEK